MNTKLRKFLKQWDKRTWFYHHLKKDSDFKKEAATLRKQIVINSSTGPHTPTGREDFDRLKAPGKETKIGLIESFMAKWNVHWDHVLLNYLLHGDENDLPPMF